jgi:spore coat protein U-like protein
VQFVVAAAVAVALAGGYSPVSAQSATANLSVSATVTRNCTITTTPIAFGNYDALSGTQVDQDGAIKLTCTKGTPTTITLGNGVTPQAGQRAMAGGTPAGFLNYELYSDNGRTTRWGNAAGQILTPPTAPDNTERSFPVYGRILSGQTSVSQGSYTDTVVATVNF